MVNFRFFLLIYVGSETNMTISSSLESKMIVYSDIFMSVWTITCVC